MPHRNTHERRTYAARRMSLAVDRLIVAVNMKEKEFAAKWIAAWSIVAGIRQSQRN